MQQGDLHETHSDVTALAKDFDFQPTTLYNLGLENGYGIDDITLHRLNNHLIFTCAISSSCIGNNGIKSHWLVLDTVANQSRGSTQGNNTLKTVVIWLLALESWKKRLILLGFDSVVIPLSVLLAPAGG